LELDRLRDEDQRRCDEWELSEKLEDRRRRELENQRRFELDDQWRFVEVADPQPPTPAASEGRVVAAETAASERAAARHGQAVRN
jgi:hypothetical protein